MTWMLRISGPGHVDRVESLSIKGYGGLTYLHWRINAQIYHPEAKGNN